MTRANAEVQQREIEEKAKADGEAAEMKGQEQGRAKRGRASQEPQHRDEGEGDSGLEVRDRKNTATKQFREKIDGSFLSVFVLCPLLLSSAAL